MTSVHYQPITIHINGSAYPTYCV